jgi:uncharacterized protein YfbU (UPF0304 family)
VFPHDRSTEAAAQPVPPHAGFTMSPKPKLSPVERALLLNQYEIRKQLEETDRYDYAIGVLQDGYSYCYDRVLGGAYHEVTEDDCKFVLDVLHMFTVIEIYKHDSGDSLEGKGLSHFAGFDGNNETSLLGFARFEIAQSNWEHLKQYGATPYTDDFNTHWPMRGTYERMLEVFRALPARPLTAEEVYSVLAAADGATS